jgi:outer membrane protein assembly factor BamB
MVWQHAVDPDGGTQFHGNPAFVDSLVVFGTDQGFGQLTGSMVALNRFTGEPHWSMRLDPGFATDLVAVGPSLLGVALDDRVVSFDPHQRTIHWETPSSWIVDAELINYEDIRSPVLASSCVVTGGMIGYAGRDQSVHALRAGTGEMAWSTAADGLMTTRLCAADSHWVVGTSNYRLQYFDVESGHIDRSVRTPLIPQETMAHRKGRLYFLGGFEDARPEDLLCIDSRTDEILWHQVIPDTSKNAFWWIPRLHFWDGAVIVGSNRGLLVAYDEVTGEIRWHMRLESAIRGIGSTPERLFVGNYDGTLYGIRARSHDD